MAILLAERSSFSTLIKKGESDITKSKVAKTRRGTRTPKAHPTSKTYAREHGLDRGGTKKLDNSPTGQPPVLDPGAADEGLLAFVQSTTCRRKIWAEAFDVPAASLEGMEYIQVNKRILLHADSFMGQSLLFHAATSVTHHYLMQHAQEYDIKHQNKVSQRRENRFPRFSLSFASGDETYLSVIMPSHSTKQSRS